MKKDIEIEFMWHLESAMIPYPIALVTTVDTQGRVNAAPFGLLLPYCSDPAKPQMLLCASSMWNTTKNIESTGEFVVNHASYGLIQLVAQAGQPYDAGVNELEKAGLTAMPALSVTPPRIAECFQHIECRLNKIDRPTEMQTNFIADVLALSMDEALVGKTRTQMLTAADPLMLYGINIVSNEGNYTCVGETRAFAPPDDAD
ncbi:MAG: flavin reductase family protein [Deltaproteobacteria bacterium]|nr:flavin reductase family protein [Deltaproteobacteria bacterium]